jgi:hypothetical protein
MTRSSPQWKWIGYAFALLGVGFKYWRLPDDGIGLPQALYGPGLVAVAVVALLLRAFGTGRFANVWLPVASSVPLAVLLRIAVDGVRGKPHLLWLTEIAIALVIGLAVSLLGTAIGSLFLLRSSQRPA